MKEKNTLI